MIRTQKNSDRASLALVPLHFHYPFPQERPQHAATQGIPRHVFAHQSSQASASLLQCCAGAKPQQNACSWISSSSIVSSLKIKQRHTHAAIENGSCKRFKRSVAGLRHMSWTGMHIHWARSWMLAVLLRVACLKTVFMVIVVVSSETLGQPRSVLNSVQLDTLTLTHPRILFRALPSLDMCHCTCSDVADSRSFLLLPILIPIAISTYCSCCTEWLTFAPITMYY